ncbi:MAG: protein kinase [Rubrivivax sp.]|nr:protein kinase [Rubrivivax sp.]
MNPPAATPDAATWARLSPLLDEALDLPPADRAAWLAALQLRAPPDAALLQGLLERHEAAGRDHFLAGSAHAGSSLPAAGHRMGPWTIEAPLGEGGMASVWLARRSDGRHEGQAAIKLMHGRLHGTQASQRFEREGRILARLEHPHIARLLDAGVASDGDGGQPYLVLELVRGEPIDRWCDERRLDVEGRLRLFVDVVQAVAAAHAQLVVHRDLKPGNVMVDGQGQVKLLDFGIARLLDEGEDGAALSASSVTRTGQRAYTPAWAAPEQVRGEPVSTATDVWALGVLLCQLLTGRHPSGLPWSSDITAWMHAAALPEPKRPSRLVAEGEDAAALAAARGLQPLRLARRLQGELDQIVLRALAEEPGRRYSSAQALADDVLRHLRNEPVSAVADTVGYRAAKFVRRNRLMVGAASTTLLALLAGVVGTSWQAVEAQRQRVQAEAQRTRAESASARALGALAAADASAAQARAESLRAESERQRAEAQRERAETEQRRAQAEAAAARRARAETELQLQAARAQRAEARYQARASSATTEFMSSLLSEIGPGGQPLKPEQLLDRGRELLEKNYAGNPALLSELLVALGVRYEILGRRESEVEMRRLAEAAARRTSDVNALANALCAAIQADIEAGRPEAAQARVTEARRVLAASAVRPRLPVEHVCLNAEADLAAARGDSATALRVSQQAVALFEAADEREDKAYIVALNNLAYHHHAAGQGKQAFEIMLKLGQVMDRTGRGGTRDRLTVMINEGSARISFGEMQQAEAVLRDAVQRAQGPDLTRPAVDMGLARAYGVALHHMRRDDEALRWLQYAAARSHEERNARIEVESLLHMAGTHLYADRGDAAQAAQAALDQASAALPAGATNAGDLLLAIDRVRARLALQRGDVPQARALMQAQLKLLGYAGAKPRAGLLTTLPIAARAALAAGEIDEARALADAALLRATAAARLPEQSSRVGRAWWLLGDVQQRQGLHREALASWQRALPILVAALGAPHPQTKELQAWLASRP